MSYLSDFEEINGGYVAFGRNPKGGKITGKGKIRTGKLDFDDVYFVKELKNRKACFVYKSLTYLIKDCNYYEKKMAQTPARNHAQRGNHQHYARMTHPNRQRHVVPTTVSTKSKLVPLTAASPVITTVP
uniref:Ribonuclease H-like domain-containing protein n=1 Tax=Tanacetum cinerariifolium TaxID=118510 RepID=A0A699RBX1_TANCI|nr:ribonuclease H-like domain-containing protein [Tanacetum cinerariifolium]